MSSLRVSFVALAVVLVSACGGTPKAGDKCDTTGFLCADGSGALQCKAGSWVNLPCRGINGCKRDADKIKCDMEGNIAGDPCASTAEGKGLCAPDGKSTLECRDGVLVKTFDCRSCAVMSDQVVCTP